MANFYLTVLEHEYEYVSDDTLYAWMAMEKAKADGDDAEYQKQKELWEEYSYRMEWYEHEIEMVNSNAKERSDYDALCEVRDRCNEWFKDNDIDMAIPPISRFEDYGLDTCMTGFTESDRFIYKEYEVKALSGRFGERDYQTTTAGRNKYCRYLDSSATQEELGSYVWSKSDIPAEFGDKPLAVLNAMTKKGTYEGSKMDTLEKAHGGLIYASKDRIWVFTPSALKKAILRGFWVYQKHTTYFGGEYSWEYKVAIDLDSASWEIPYGIPEEKLKKIND